MGTGKQKTNLMRQPWQMGSLDLTLKSGLGCVFHQRKKNGGNNGTS